MYIRPECGVSMSNKTTYDRLRQLKTIAIILVVVMTCLLFAGCGHDLSGKYTSESGYYSIKFYSDGTCTWYQSGYSFDGTYYWDSHDDCYYIEIRGSGYYIDTTFKARPEADGLYIKGGTVRETFTKHGSDGGSIVTVILIIFWVLLSLLVLAGIVVLVVVLTRKKNDIHYSVVENQQQKAVPIMQNSYCPNCGLAHNPEQNFCKKCGCRLQ